MAAGDVWLFDRFAPVYDRLVPAADVEALMAGLARAGRPVRTVVDLGGGTGRGVRALDPPEAIVVDAARGMLRHAPGGVHRIRGDASALPLRDGSVDAVLVVDALHHMDDQPAVIAGVARVLRPGGVLVVQEFDVGTLRGRLLAAAERLVGFRAAFRTADGLVEMLGDAGLEASAVSRGFSCVVAGTKSGGP